MLLQDTIGIYPKAFSNELCDTLLKMYDTALTTGTTYEGTTGGEWIKRLKTQWTLI